MPASGPIAARASDREQGLPRLACPVSGVACHSVAAAARCQVGCAVAGAPLRLHTGPGALVRPPARPFRVPLSANPPRTLSPTRNPRLNATFNLTRPCGAKLQGTLARAPPQSSRININLAPPNEQGRQHSEAPTPFFRLGLRLQRATCVSSPRHQPRRAVETTGIDVMLAARLLL